MRLLARRIRLQNGPGNKMSSTSALSVGALAASTGRPLLSPEFPSAHQEERPRGTALSAATLAAQRHAAVSAARPRTSRGTCCCAPLSWGSGCGTSALYSRTWGDSGRQRRGCGESRFRAADAASSRHEARHRPDSPTSPACRRRPSRPPGSTGLRSSIPVRRESAMACVSIAVAPAAD